MEERERDVISGGRERPCLGSEVSPSMSRSALPAFMDMDGRTDGDGSWVRGCHTPYFVSALNHLNFDYIRSGIRTCSWACHHHHTRIRRVWVRRTDCSNVCRLESQFLEYRPKNYLT